MASNSLPVALFVGGTGGIGRGIVEAFLNHTKGRAHVIICGRDAAAAQSTISWARQSFPQAQENSGSLYEFVKCDATLMKNVHVTTKSLLERLPKLNYLVLTAGMMTYKGRQETEEGIDRKLALHYYSRWVFIHDLIPLLVKATALGADAKVLSVLAAGQGGPIDLDDLGLKKHFSLVNAAHSAITYNDLMVEEFASRYPDVAFTHSYPGVVRTNLFSSIHWTMRLLSPLLAIITYPFTFSPLESGQYMLTALLSGEKGAYRRGPKGEDIGKKNYFSTDEGRKRLWEHTIQITASETS